MGSCTVQCLQALTGPLAHFLLKGSPHGGGIWGPCLWSAGPGQAEVSPRAAWESSPFTAQRCGCFWNRERLESPSPLLPPFSPFSIISGSNAGRRSLSALTADLGKEMSLPVSWKGCGASVPPAQVLAPEGDGFGWAGGHRGHRGCCLGHRAPSLLGTTLWAAPLPSPHRPLSALPGFPSTELQLPR